MRIRVILCIWCSSLLIGFGLLMYDAFHVAPQPIAISSLTTVQSSAYQHSSFSSSVQTSPLLLFFAHPHCPCTRASFHELLHILRSTSSVAYTVHIVFFQPDSTEPRSLAWMSTSDTWKLAQTIVQEFPSAHIIADTNGRIAQAYHVTTSGHTILYADNGSLLFDGGITPSRGHEGDNRGRRSIISLLQGSALPDNNTPITRTYTFGCSLLNPQQSATQQ